MATWSEVSVDAFKASSRMREQHPRSAVSRAYYAAYSAVTHELTKDKAITFSRGRGNPEHGRVLDYVQESFARRGFTEATIDQLRRNLRDLRRDRERADYKPLEEIDEADARASLRLAEQTIRELGLPL